MALPVNGSKHVIPALLLIYRPRKDERLSWPSWLTYSGWSTHISGHPSTAGRAQDRESSPVKDRRSTTVLRHQPPSKGSLRIRCMVKMIHQQQHRTGGGISNDYGYRRPHRMQSMGMRPVVTDVAWSFYVSVCSVNQSINQSICRSIDRSINQRFICFAANQKIMKLNTKHHAFTNTIQYIIKVKISHTKLNKM